MKSNSRIVVSITVAVLLVLLQVAASFWYFGKVETAASLRKHSFVSIDLASDLLMAITDAETSERGYLITGNEVFLAPYMEAKPAIPVLLAALREPDADDVGRARLDAAGPLIAAKMADISRIIELRRNQDMAGVQQAVGSGNGKRLMDSIRVQIGEYIDLQRAALAEHEVALQSNMRSLLAVMVVAGLFVLVFCVSLVYLIYLQAQQKLQNVIHFETQASLRLQGEINAKLKHAYDDLQDREEKLAVTLSSIGDGVITTDAEACIILLNPIAEKLTGWMQAEAHGRPIAEIFKIINKETRKAATIPVADALAHGTVQGLANHTVLIAREGAESDIADSCAPIRDREGKVVGAVLVFRDVTAEYAVQQELRDRSALVQTVLNTVADGIITFQADGGIIEKVNPASERMFGCSAAEFVGQGVSLFIPELDRDQLNGSLEYYRASDAALASGLGREVFGRRKDGTAFPMEMAVSEMWLAGQRYFTGILRDISVRRSAEEVLLKTGALQSAIFNSANFSSIATDAKGVIQIFNVGAERMLGYTAAEVMNKITPADISDPREVIARASALSLELDTPITPGFEALVFKASRGIEDIYELTYIRKDGSRFPAMVSVTALRDAQEGIIGYLLIGTDNTARKRAEEELIKAGALQSAIFNSANFSSIATDAKGVIQIFNVGAERMLGYTAAEVMNKITPAEISDPQEVIARASTLSRELDTPITPGFEALVFKASRGIEDIYELTYIRKDGSRFPAIVSVTALRDAQEGIIGYLLIGTDNTARKQVEATQALLDQKIRDQQFYTRSLIESNIDALMTTDPQGIISDVNQQMVALTGRTRDELIGSPCRNFFTDPDLADVAIKRVLAENKVSNYELTVRSQNGDETVVSYNAATFHDRDRKLQGVFAAARDVTDRKRFERTLQEKNIELEHASRMKSGFLATMSHELRTPLNAIIGFSEALKDGLIGKMSDTQEEYIGDIFTSGLHLLSLINDILDLSKVEAGMMALELEPVDLHSLLSNSLSIVREKAAAQQIHLDLEIPEHLGEFQLDVRKTKQIVYNLLSNAVKFSANGGRVILRAQKVSRDSVGVLDGSWPVYGFPLADNAYGEFLEICVSDTGIGISKLDMAKLFQAFSQIDSSLARKFEGTGLGLAMVKQLVELHGGTVAVASLEGEGACFAAWLPLQAVGPAGNTAPRETVVATPVVERTALVIEDDEAAAELVRLLLEAEGFTVLLAPSAEVALAMVTRQPLSLITLDIQLPGIDGWEFLLQIRENNELAHVPVVVIAGSVDRHIALTRGAAAVLQKPVRRAQLRASLADMGMDEDHGRVFTILVVDDDPKAVEVIAAFLPAPAYAVVRAYGGTEAISLAYRLRPDLVVLDLMMPGVNGFDVVEALQLHSETASIPILVVTAKHITSLDRAVLNGKPGRPVSIVEKAGFDRAVFVAEVRRALPVR